ncbi:osteopontin [Scomber scombrus]|uniref:Osteopontin n=1 Tax=Scomber scombrus TaxID=13677 RepID=A0AAV1PTG3_SCOSC
MKVAIVFVLLFATVLCRPAKKVSSSESSEEVVKADAPLTNDATVQNAAATTSSDESSDEEGTAAPDTTSSSDTASVDSKDSDDDDDESDETDEDDEESSNSSESGESSTAATVTVTPVIVTEEPVVETTPEPILPTIVTDADSGRGDSLGGYPGDYKSIVYVEDKSYHKVPAYKSYELVGAGKKMAYDMNNGNEVEKTLKVYKALQIHSDLLEEDTSTPDVESQGLDATLDQDASFRQASLPEESTSSSDTSSSDGSSDASSSDGSSDASSSDGSSSSDSSASDASTSDSSSAPEAEEEEESTSDSTASPESEDEESSEEATATPGASDSDSDESESSESDSDEDKAVPDATTDMPAVITAK